MGDHVRKLSDAQGNVSDEDRDKHVFLVPQDVRQDLLLVATLMADTYDQPLPSVALWSSTEMLNANR